MPKTSVKRLVRIAGQVPVVIMKEGRHFVAYTPALDLSTAGKTHDEARARFEEAVEIFFEEVVRHGTLEDALLDLGWTRQAHELVPPMVVSNESVTIPRKFHATPARSMAAI